MLDACTRQRRAPEGNNDLENMLAWLEDRRSKFSFCKNFRPRQLSVSLGGLLLDCAPRHSPICPRRRVDAVLFIENHTHMTDSTCWRLPTLGAVRWHFPQTRLHTPRVPVRSFDLRSVDPVQVEAFDEGQVSNGSTYCPLSALF